MPRAISPPTPTQPVRIAKSSRSSRRKKDQPEEIIGNRKRIALVCLFLVIATLAVYAPVARNSFVNYDDNLYVYENPHVTSGLSWQNIKWSTTALAAANWHPLTWISHMLDFQLFGLRAGGHHVTSLLIHVLNVVLVFLLLWQVTGRPGRSLLVAALFALHPLNVESVAWIAERKNVLCTLFFLLALAAYGWYARKPEVKRYLLVALLFLLGLASKPMVITLPFVLLLLDFWPLGRIAGWSTPSPAFPVPQTSFSRLAKEKVPLLALCVGSAVITIVAQHSSEAITSISDWTLTWRLENSLNSYAKYLWKAFFPTGLAPFYPGFILPFWRVALALVFLLAAGWLVWKLRRGRPYLVTGCLWYLGTLVPMIGIVQVGSQSMADRYTYLPMLGIFAAVVWGIFDAAGSNRLAVRWSVGVSALVLALLGLLTWRQVGYWQSSADLWSHALDVTVNNYVAEQNLGLALEHLGRDEEALSHFMNVKLIRPKSMSASVHIGTALERLGRHQEAIAELEDALRNTNEPLLMASAYRALGVAYAQTGDRAKARQSFLQAMRLQPEGPSEFYNLSLLELQEAVDKMSRQVSSHPTAEGYLQLGQLLHEERDLPNAQVAYERALQLNPNLAEARQALQQLKGTNE